MASEVKNKPLTLDCVIRVVGSITATINAVAAAWGAIRVIALAAGGEAGNKVRKVGDTAVIHDGEHRMYAVVLPDDFPEFIANYGKAIGGVDTGKIFAALSKCRTKADVLKTQIEFGGSGVEFPNLIFSGSKFKRWQKCRTDGNLSAQKSGSIIVLPWRASAAVAYGGQRGRVGTGTADATADAVGLPTRLDFVK